MSRWGIICNPEALEPAIAIGLIADDFDHYALGSIPVELAIENLFPCSKIQGPVCNSHNDFAPHDLSFEVSVPVFLAIVSTNCLGKLTTLPNLFSLGFAAISLGKVYDDTSLDHVNRRTRLEAYFQRPACCPA
jgi:hypothetical protein